MNDWIHLLVKYKGLCVVCGKEISVGQYALWSKSSKAIKHNKCAAPMIATTIKRKLDTNRQQTKVSEVNDCFICGRLVTSTNTSFEDNNYDKEATSQASICDECLEDKNAYQNYQRVFLEKVHKISRVILY